MVVKRSDGQTPMIESRCWNLVKKHICLRPAAIVRNILCPVWAKEHDLIVILSLPIYLRNPRVLYFIPASMHYRLEEKLEFALTGCCAFELLVLGKILFCVYLRIFASVPKAGEIDALSSRNLIVRLSKNRKVSSGTRDRRSGLGELKVAARTRTLPNCLQESQLCCLVNGILTYACAVPSMLVITRRAGTLSKAVVLLIAASTHLRHSARIHSSNWSGPLVVGGLISFTRRFDMAAL